MFKFPIETELTAQLVKTPHDGVAVHLAHVDPGVGGFGIFYDQNPDVTTRRHV